MRKSEQLMTRILIIGAVFFRLELVVRVFVSENEALIKDDG